MCKHYECLYYVPDTESCDYLIISGRRRGCLPTDDCIRLCTNPKDMVIARPRFYHPRVVHKDQIERMAKEYQDGMDTKTLSEKAKVPQVEAYRWMCKVHPESPYLIKHKDRLKGW